MSLAGFQRRRRELAKLEAKNALQKQEDTNVLEETEGAVEEAVDVSKLTLKQVRKELDKLGVKYAHNTGEQKLREKLQDELK